MMLTPTMELSRQLVVPDPGVPQLSRVLDPDHVAATASALLGHRVRTPVVVQARARYVPGEELVTLHRVRDRQRTHLVAQLAVGGWRVRELRELAGPAEAALPSGAPRPLLDDDRTTLSWLAPWDPGLPHLATALDRPDALRDIVGSEWTRSTLLGYHPTRSATLRCTDHRGRTMAFVMLYPTVREAQDAVRRTNQLTAVGARIPAVLGTVPSLRAVVVSALPGRPVARLAPADLAVGLAAAARALATLHGLRAHRLPADRRADITSLHKAATTIGAARPDCAQTARQLATALQAMAPPPGPPVVVHGKVATSRALLDHGEACLVDLERVALGNRCTDVAVVLAGLRLERLVGWTTPRREVTLATAFRSGYERAAGAPLDDDELRWHVAAVLLAGQAQDAVTRLLPHLLARLPQALDEGLALLERRTPLDGMGVQRTG